MEAKEFLNQKRIGLVNKFYYQVLEIKKNGAEPDIPLLMKEVERILMILYIATGI